MAPSIIVQPERPALHLSRGLAGMLGEGGLPLGTFTIPASSPPRESHPAREALLNATGTPIICGFEEVY